MGREIWCRTCSWKAFVIAGVTPDACGDCGAVGLWTYEPPEPEPVLVLSESDVRFLRQQRIAVDDRAPKA